MQFKSTHVESVNSTSSIMDPTCGVHKYNVGKGGHKCHVINSGLHMCVSHVACHQWWVPLAGSTNATSVKVGPTPRMRCQFVILVITGFRILGFRF